MITTGGTAARRPEPGAGFTMPASVVEIATGLYAVGGGIPAETSISWISEGLRGWVPFQCYVFLGEREALVLDSGLGLHRQCIAEGLDRLLAGRGAPRLLVSRWEPDAMVNLPWLVDRYRIREVLSLGGINPLDFFDGFDAAAVQSNARTQAAPADLVTIAPGDRLTVEDFELEVINPSLRLLLTTWFYERRSRSLFTADSFGFLPNPFSPWPWVARPQAQDVTPQVVEHALVQKFDWLCGAYCDSLIEDLQQLATKFDIERLCPTFGATIEGRAAVEQVFSSTVEALQCLSGQSRRRALADFDWATALSPQAVLRPADLRPIVIPRIAV
ncbi:MBL fold metallo-hydrolase [Bosea psychrotolerans]|uniref:Glyoxylase-like metal-dependent hydrolase (Beta-lactamase superfamily II) n=1 Tax=Bosea psychrotolerans TaxID=1871628 RepID=A0A2S4MB39_9HYPH|nr:MBL fold metallo-hydrolase [Bosea psychrotolerans]POR51956.1 glyoxylase-like metal-dependent hydrolase (beta-lactamase superfamily II) [Bosea psychrotolerans]